MLFFQKGHFSLQNAKKNGKKENPIFNPPDCQSENFEVAFASHIFYVGYHLFAFKAKLRLERGVWLNHCRHYSYSAVLQQISARPETL